MSERVGSNPRPDCSEPFSIAPHEPLDTSHAARHFALKMVTGKGDEKVERHKMT